MDHGGQGRGRCGHVTYQGPSTCIDEWRVRHLVGLEVPERGTSCAADQVPIGP